jgi:hypothetical protein
VRRHRADPPRIARPSRACEAGIQGHDGAAVEQKGAGVPEVVEPQQRNVNSLVWMPATAHRWTRGRGSSSLHRPVEVAARGYEAFSPKAKGR